MKYSQYLDQKEYKRFENLKSAVLLYDGHFWHRDLEINVQEYSDLLANTTCLPAAKTFRFCTSFVTTCELS